VFSTIDWFEKKKKSTIDRKSITYIKSTFVSALKKENCYMLRKISNESQEFVVVLSTIKNDKSGFLRKKMIFF